jgi:uncharacterized membrane protein YgdD (TMEM256/DUF423 family)
MDRTFVALGAVFAFIGVLLGAFAAHGLKGHLTVDHLDTFQTAVRYQMYHALGLVVVGWASTRWPARGLVWTGWLFAAGIVLFSGSLYALALTGMRALGAIAPLGGAAFLAGWATLGVSVWRAGDAERA